MNVAANRNRLFLQVLGVGGLLVLLILILRAALGGSSKDTGAQRNANSTRTAIAMTSNALLGPFPTSTAPLVTASTTPTSTVTPTNTPTYTPTFTPTLFVIDTVASRTRAVRATLTNTPLPTTTPRPTQTKTPIPQPTNTQVFSTIAPQPTNTPNLAPTNTAVPTSPPSQPTATAMAPTATP